jgi:hypothetical protein
MSRIERAASDLNPDVPTLRDDELEAANGGIIIIGGLGALGGPDTRVASHKDWIEVLSYSHG